MKGKLQDKKLRRIAAVVLILVPVAFIAWYLIGGQSDKNLPTTTRYQSNLFLFDYPRAGVLKEYGTGAVSIGNEIKGDFQPLVEVVRYQNDPDVAPPASFEAFAKKQATDLCGSDGPIESVTCSKATAEPYRTPGGEKGLKLAMTITRTNLKSGTTTAATFAPIYAIDLTGIHESKYEAVFIYHSLSAVLAGSISPALLDQIMSSIHFPVLEQRRSNGGA